METEQYTVGVAVVPGYYLVCYNESNWNFGSPDAVVPGYYLVCYNESNWNFGSPDAVVPGYYLVCYNMHLFYFLILLL